jgi:hypothetical protein
MQDSRPSAPVATLDIPVFIRRAKTNIATRIVVSAIAATLIAMPGILGDTVEIAVRVSMASAGALVLAFGFHYLRITK